MKFNVPIHLKLSQSELLIFTQHLVFTYRFALIYQLSKDIAQKQSTKMPIRKGRSKYKSKEEKEIIEDALYAGKVIQYYM